MYDELLGRFVSMSTEILGDALVGVYLHGSAAMGCFNPEKSDLDLIVVTGGDIDDTQKLRFMNELVALNDEAPAKGLEMSIVRRQYCDPPVYPTPFELHFSPAHLDWFRRSPREYIEKMNGTDRDLAAHFAVIKHCGRVLYGEPIDTVFGEVSRDIYIDSIMYDIGSAHEDIAGDPIYVTLNLCRALAYVRGGLILSKQQGGEWALAHLPQEHLPIVREAVRCYLGSDIMTAPENAAGFARFMLGRIRQHTGAEQAHV